MGYDESLFESEQVPAHFKCPICHDVLDQPCTITTCQHVYCFQCIRQVLQISNHRPTCPQCRQLFANRDVRPTERIFQKMINGLRIRCSKQNCRAVVELGNLKRHQSTIQCPTLLATTTVAVQPMEQPQQQQQTPMSTLLTLGQPEAANGQHSEMIQRSLIGGGGGDLPCSQFCGATFSDYESQLTHDCRVFLMERVNQLTMELSALDQNHPEGLRNQQSTSSNRRDNTGGGLAGRLVQVMKEKSELTRQLHQKSESFGQLMRQKSALIVKVEQMSIEKTELSAQVRQLANDKAELTERLEQSVQVENSQQSPNSYRICIRLPKQQIRPQFNANF